MNDMLGKEKWNVMWMALYEQACDRTHKCNINNICPCILSLLFSLLLCIAIWLLYIGMGFTGSEINRESLPTRSSLCFLGLFDNNILRMIFSKSIVLLCLWCLPFFIQLMASSSLCELIVLICIHNHTSSRQSYSLYSHLYIQFNSIQFNILVLWCSVSNHEYTNLLTTSWRLWTSALDLILFNDPISPNVRKQNYTKHSPHSTRCPITEF